MRKAICFTLILISTLLAPFIAQATSTIPNRVYYSNGVYDGGLWYSATTGTGTSLEYEHNDPGITDPYLSWGAIIDVGDWEAQTFTPQVNYTINQIDLNIYRKLDGGNLRVSVFSVAGHDPDVELTYAQIDVTLVTDNTDGAWYSFYPAEYDLVAGTQYAIVIDLSAPDAANSLWVRNCGAIEPYPRGNRHYTTDNGTVWHNVNADLQFRTYGIQTIYSQAHDSVVGNISANIITSVGQRYNSTTGEYRIDRGALFFNTEDLLTTDNIQSATLQFWTAADYSATNFEITAVDGSGLNGPLQTSDYYELLLNTDNKGSVTTASISTTGYTTITITDLSIINKIGYTKIGLRSSREIAETIPTGNEYVDIYMGESLYPPILTINYTVGVLGIPDEMGMSKVCVYSGYRQTADEIFVWQNTLIYETEPDIGPTEYFIVQLLASDNSVIGQTVVNDWGYTPLSIYLDNITATTILPWKSTCSLLLTGSSLYGTPTGFTPHRYEVQSTDWRGLVEPWKPPGKSILDGWCKATTNWMEGKYGVVSGTYSTTGPEGQWCFHPYEQAGALFIEGIPYIKAVRPGLFVFSDTVLNPGTPISGTWATGIYSAVWGTYWSTAFLNLAGGWGLAGQWVIGIIWGFVIASLGGMTRQLTGDPNISLVIMFFGAIIGVALGSIAMSIALVITIILWGAFLHNVLLSRT